MATNQRKVPCMKHCPHLKVIIEVRMPLLPLRLPVQSVMKVNRWIVFTKMPTIRMAKIRGASHVFLKGKRKRD